LRLEGPRHPTDGMKTIPYMYMPPFTERVWPVI
jgi:hypothetical protein